VCNVLFRYLRAWKGHTFRRNNECPYSCILCGKGFINQSLIVHMHVHSGEHPYVCNVCDNSFAQKSALKTHQHVHTGERPYICDVCTKTFGDKRTLTRHQVFVLKSVHLCVMLVTNHLDARIILTDVFPCTV
jgi:uncharacterized Zn-finger protein